MNQKRCSKCDTPKDAKEFSTQKSSKDGLQRWCKVCVKRYNNKRRERISEEIKKKEKTYRDMHKKEIAASNSKYWKTKNGKAIQKRANHKRRALTRNTEVTFTIEQWGYILKKQDNRCNICGRKFTTKRPATQDHIIPVMHNGNYSSDNIQALCKSCNSGKRAKLDFQFIQTWNHNMGVKG